VLTKQNSMAQQQARHRLQLRAAHRSKPLGTGTHHPAQTATKASAELQSKQQGGAMVVDNAQQCYQLVWHFSSGQQAQAGTGTNLITQKVMHSPIGRSTVCKALAASRCRHCCLLVV
jgi:hypothetical protein